MAPSYPVAAYRCSLMAASTMMRASPVGRGILQRCDAISYDASAGILLAAYLAPVGMSTKAPPAASETSAASRMRTTLRPSRASLRGVVPSMMHSEKWRHSIANGALQPTWGLPTRPEPDETPD